MSTRRLVYLSAVTPKQVKALFANAPTDELARGKARAIMRIHGDCAPTSGERPGCLMCGTHFAQSELLRRAAFLFVGSDVVDDTETAVCVICVPCVMSRSPATIQSAAAHVFAEATGASSVHMLSEGGHA